MKKFILMMLVVSIVFVSCDNPAPEVKVFSNGVESTASFEDYFNLEIIVKDNNNTLSIIMDKNTEVLYIMSYHYAISPIYDSDGTIMTKEKWFARRKDDKSED